MRFLITGSAGMLGRDVVRAAEVAGHDVVALARADLDVTDEAAVRRAVAAAAPGAVVNCAAWTDVDGAEADEAAATRVNGGGAGYVADAAAAAGAAVVHVSSDYVFDGTKDAPYVESDPTAPLSAYGRGKLAGERAVLEGEGARAVVRSSWLFGAGGRNFVETMLKLAGEGVELRVVGDQIGCPTFTGHLAPVLVALATGRASGLFHVAGTGAASWHGFAREIFDAAGVAADLHETTSAEFPRPAPRPAFSVLVSERRDAPRLAPWQQGLAAYLAERAAAPGDPAPPGVAA
ncbi:MAG TPA: dTDP-4-dehydrorhamnose reductase [Solirubrobacteraceae bacterium]|nr:dTDP-4-dehydrorhamnose reductase [Solirubrobacteraceae bacterium]